MAIIPAKRFLPYPHWPSNASSVPSTSTITAVMAAGNGVAYVFIAPNNKIVTKAHFRTGTVAVAGNGTCRVQLETVTTGTAPSQPTGTLVGAGGTVDVTIAAADDDIIKTATFGTPVQLVQGQVISLTLTITNMDTLTSISFLGYADERSLMIPYALINTGGVYSFSNNGPIFTLEYDDGTCEPIGGIDCFQTVAAVHQITNASNPLISGNNIICPWAGTVCGGWAWLDTDATGFFRLVRNDYHQANGTGILGSAAIDPGYRSSNAVGIHLFWFANDATVTAGQEVRAIVEGTAAGIITTHYQILPAANLLGSRNGGGTTVQQTTCTVSPTGDGDWTDTPTRVNLMGLLYSGFDDGSTPPPPPTVINGRPVLII